MGTYLIGLTTEVKCPLCSKITVFRHLESYNSPVKVVSTCIHAVTYTQDGTNISVEFKEKEQNDN